MVVRIDRRVEAWGRGRGTGRGRWKRESGEREDIWIQIDIHISDPVIKDIRKCRSLLQQICIRMVKVMICILWIVSVLPDVQSVHTPSHNYRVDILHQSKIIL